MNTDIKRSILEKIKEYNRIIIARHKRPDGDAVGSTMGLCLMLQATFPGKQVWLANDDRAEYTAFLGDEGYKPEIEEYADALAVVIDTGTLDRVSNENITKCREIIKIDHHIDDKPFGDISWVEEDRSSACEMIVDFYVTFKDELVLPKKAAECLYTGMVTDSGRFRFDGTSPSTLRLAAELIELGIDTERLYANLYMSEYSMILKQAELTARIQITENGVAYLDIPKSLRENMGMTLEDASNCVSLMDSIKGSLIWLAFIENDDGSTRVRLRSRFVTVQELATRYHGGGHACASGATIYSEDEKRSLLAEADALLADYKKNNEGWL